ncbi:prominin-1-like isoform X2 [Paramacrobiotus metropolitanus]|nr:prominin-1-like isoform X2 [Paramacrobiotus metropolitanus]
MVEAYKGITQNSDFVGYLKKPEVMGLVVFLSIGVIYVIVMLLGCVFYVSYRCCCRKGRLKYYPDGQRKKRGSLSLGIWMCGILTFCGLVLVYLSGNDLAYGLDISQDIIDGVIVDMRNMMNDTNIQIQFITKEGFDVAHGNVSKDLNAIGSIIYAPFKENLKTLGVVSELRQIGLFEQLNNAMLGQVILVQQAARDLQGQKNAINSQLNKIWSDLITACNAQSNPPAPVSCQTAPGALITEIFVDNTFIPVTLPLLQTGLESVQQANLTKRMQDAFTEIDTIPQLVTTQTAQSRQDIETSMTNLHDDLDDYLQPIEGMTSSMMRILDDARATAHSFTDIPKTYGPYISTAGSVIASWFLLITLLYVTGSILGAWKFDRTVLPTDRKGWVVLAGNLLFVAVHLMLYLAWLLMLLTVLLMVLGTQIDEVLCPILESEKTQFVQLDQTLESVNQSLTPVNLDLGGKTLKVAPLLSSCKDNTPMYTAMDMKDLFDVTSLQDRTKKFDIDKKMSNLRVDLTKIKVFDSDTEKVIEDGLQATAELQQPMDEYLKTDIGTGYLLNPQSPTLTDFANQLRSEYYSTLPQDDAAKFEDVVNQCRTLAVSITQTQTSRDILRKKIGTLNDTTRSYIAQGKSAKAGGRGAQDFFAKPAEQGTPKTSATALILQLCQNFGRRINNYMQQYMRFVIFSVQSNIGLCKPVYTAFHAFVGLLCGSIIQPINGVWFAIGLCLALHIPLLFMNVRLARFYLRAKALDVPKEPKLQVQPPIAL